MAGYSDFLLSTAIVTVVGALVGLQVVLIWFGLGKLKDIVYYVVDRMGSENNWGPGFIHQAREERRARLRTSYDRTVSPPDTGSAVAPAGSGVTDGDALGPSAQLNALFAALRISTATITESILPHQVDPVTRRCQHCGADDRAILFYRNTDTPIRCVPATHEVAAEMAVATQQPVVRPANQRCERSIIIE